MLTMPWCDEQAPSYLLLVIMASKPNVKRKVMSTACAMLSSRRMIFVFCVEQVRVRATNVEQLRVELVAHFSLSRPLEPEHVTYFDRDFEEYAMLESLEQLSEGKGRLLVNDGNGDGKDMRWLA